MSNLRKLCTPESCMGHITSDLNIQHKINLKAKTWQQEESTRNQSKRKLINAKKKLSTRPNLGVG